MAKKSKKVFRKRKSPLPEKDEKQKQMILEEVLSLSGKHVDNTCVSPPAKLMRSTNKIKEEPPTPEKEMNTKKISASLPSSPSKLRKNSTSEKGVPVTSFPDGWRREVLKRKTGKTAGQIDIYYYSPEGRKLRSRPDVASYLIKHKCGLKIEDFDFNKTLKTDETVIKKEFVSENCTSLRRTRKSFQDQNSNGVVEEKTLEAKCIRRPRSCNQPPSSEAKGKNWPNAKSNKAIEKKGAQGIKKGDQLDVKSTCVSPPIKLENSDTVKAIPFTEEKKMSVSFPLLRPSKLRKINDGRRAANVLDDVKIPSSDKAVPVTADPKDWRKNLVVRKAGTTADQINVYVVNDLLLTPFSSSENGSVPVSNAGGKKKDPMNVEDTFLLPPAKLTRSKTFKKIPPAQEKTCRMSVLLPTSPPSKLRKVNTVCNKSSPSEKGVPVSNLPNGWKRQVVVRKTGKTAGRSDVYFYSPDGTKLRSRKEIASYITKHKISLKVDEFIFKKDPTAPMQTKNSWKNDMDLGDSSKAVSTKMSRPVRKFPSQVPPPACAKQDNGVRSCKLIKKIFCHEQLFEKKKIKWFGWFEVDVIIQGPMTICVK